MFETIGVLVVFFFLLVVGSAFYFGAQRNALERERSRAAEQLAFQITLKALYLPELDCSFLMTSRENCIDLVKLRIFEEQFHNETIKSIYVPTFGFSTIQVREIWPDQTEILLYHNEPREAYSKNLTSLNPILLFDAISNTYAFGVMNVTVHAP
jgi:hypothetical protein